MQMERGHPVRVCCTESDISCSLLRTADKMSALQVCQIFILHNL
jgi:hypothetical protein